MIKDVATLACVVLTGIKEQGELELPQLFCYAFFFFC